jgi:3-phosphoshikimate 1-carboxyvinyltransferase
VRGTGALHGIDADLSEVSELTPVLAALAALADGRRSCAGRAHPRPRDRPDRRARPRARQGRRGVTEHRTGWTITPGPLRRRTFETYATTGWRTPRR